MEECFKVIPCDWDKAICIFFPLILLPAEADLISKKTRSKKHLVSNFISSGGKVILTLLTKLVISFMRFIVIYIQEAGF